MPETTEVKRLPVDFNYEALNPTFLKWMAKIPILATEKYGSWHQYMRGRLVDTNSPINHIIEHVREYREGAPYDAFDGDVRWHLVAVAYNAMMEFFYCSKWVAPKNPFDLAHEEEAAKASKRKG
jgi:hypothetical protein